MVSGLKKWFDDTVGPPGEALKAVRDISTALTTAFPSPKRSSNPPVSSALSSPRWKHSMAKAMVEPAEMVSMP